MRKRLIALLVLFALGVVFYSGTFAEKDDYATLGYDMVNGYSFWRIDSTGEFIPGADNTLDIGTSSKEVKDLYIDGVAYVDALDSLTVNNDTTIGDASSDSLVVNSSATFKAPLAIPRAADIRGALIAEVTGQIYLNTSTDGEVCVATGTARVDQWMIIDGSADCSD